MPVTAKFSREFYDKFGHEVVDELVNFLNRIDAGYRSELKELNELNFSRFDAKLEQRAAQLDAKIDQRVAQLEARIEQRVGELQGAFEAALERRIGQAESRLIRWTFAFWAPTMLAFVGLVIALMVKL